MCLHINGNEISMTDAANVITAMEFLQIVTFFLGMCISMGMGMDMGVILYYVICSMYYGYVLVVCLSCYMFMCMCIVYY
ncbi:hypothetical protein EON63_01900 [archaeon]|nr:MAG: hypothetical protein EON63_01900 [archaeon]